MRERCSFATLERLPRSRRNWNSRPRPLDEQTLARQRRAGPEERAGGAGQPRSHLAQWPGRQALNIAGRKYTRGVYCHAVGKILVRLPGPGETFTAAVGIDTNDFTSNGHSSVVFSVSVGERQLYTSKLMREGMPGEAVSVNLGGATAFTLDVGDGGDGIGCDQSDWADAKVVLADGKEVWLGDLNIIGEGVNGGPPMSFLYGGKRSSELLPAWTRTCDSGKIDDTRTRRTITWTDDKTKLVVRAEVVTYRDFPTAEWTLYFRNAGDKDAPILSDIRAWTRRCSVARRGNSCCTTTPAARRRSTTTARWRRRSGTSKPCVWPRAAGAAATACGRTSTSPGPRPGLSWLSAGRGSGRPRSPATARPG